MEKLITTLEDDLELLSRRSAQDLPYDLMRKLTDVPETLLLAFREVYTLKQQYTYSNRYALLAR
ncbi:MAG: hypothetical protein R2795_10545 [Saprospiraceae bacterium]